LQGADDGADDGDVEEEEAAVIILRVLDENNSEGLAVEGIASKPLSRSQFDQDTDFVNAHQDETQISGDTLARIRDILKRWGPCLDGFLSPATPGGAAPPPPPPPPPSPGKGSDLGGLEITKYAQVENGEGTQTGLFNGGNTCYQNALFQAFAKTTAFINMLRDMNRKKLEKLTSAEKNFKNPILAINFRFALAEVPPNESRPTRSCGAFALLNDKFCPDILHVFSPVVLQRTVRCKNCQAMSAVAYDKQCPVAVSITSGPNSDLRLEDLLQFGKFQPMDAGNEVDSLCDCHLTKKGEQEDAVFLDSFPNRMTVQIKRFEFVDDGSPAGWVAKD
jgi:hypothetical protein